MTEQPLVSVLMTAYNREKYIEEAIESVLASHYSNFELIIVDDHSNDDTVQIARTYQEKDNRVKVFVNEKNLGDYPNRNKAASYAIGKYLKYLDSDDTIYKYTLNYMVEAMEKFPEAALAICIDKEHDGKPFPKLSSVGETYKAEYLTGSILGFGPSAAIIRKKSFDETGGFSGKQFIGDHELWLKLAAKFPVIKLQTALIAWRQHSDQQIVHEKNNIEIINIRYLLSKTMLDDAKSLFADNEFSFAMKKIKRNYARNILKMMIVNGKLKNGLKLWKSSQLTVTELLHGFLPYL
ncbi:MAG: glycosyltransferase family 2 protein [Segetibacter sp.]|nr:glycosyltransferase family 2 protein [Segetibacter sp.]